MSSTAAIDASARGLKLWRPRGRLRLHAAVAAASFVCYIAARFTDGALSTAFSVVGVGACGWSWLFARALFDPAERDAAWAPIIGLVLAATGAVAVLASGAVGRVADNVYALSGSAALMLTFVEPFLRYRPDLPPVEKRFRFGFIGFYTVLVAVSMLGLWTVGEGPQADLRDDLIKAACALAALVMVVASVRFRLRHPLAVPAAAPPRRAATADDAALAERLTRLLAEQDLAARPELKIAEVAALLRQPEHRVSQAIGALGFPNFNRWINHHRIVRAKALLADPAERRSILEIAFACGFASLGPFNRAFREDTGAPPRAWRAQQRSAG